MQLIKALFLDIGGVLLTNGWDHGLRKKTAETFGIEYDEMDKRHQLVFDMYERGAFTLEEYLDRIIFFKKRAFSLEEIKAFILNSAHSFSEMIDLIKELKRKHHLKVVAVSNEGRELVLDRIERFNLASFIDFFIVSSFVRLKKPDPNIYRLALDVIQLSPDQIVYIDDRELLVEMSKPFGFQTIHHVDVHSTRQTLQKLLGS